MNNKDYLDIQRKSSVRKVFLVHMSGIASHLKEIDLATTKNVCFELASVIGEMERGDLIFIKASSPTGIHFSKQSEFYVSYMPGLLLRKIVFDFTRLAEILTPRGKDIKKWSNLKQSVLQTFEDTSYGSYSWIPRSVILDVIGSVHHAIVVSYQDMSGKEDYDREEAKAWVKYWLSRLEIPIDAIVTHDKFVRLAKNYPKTAKDTLVSAIYTHWPEIAE